MNRYSTLPPLPARIARLDELAIDLWWSWHPEGRAVFRRLDYDAWRATAHNPVRMLVGRSARAARSRGERPGVPRALRSGHRGARRVARGRQHVVGAHACRTWRGRRSPTSPPSSRCISRCRSTPAASACWPGDHCKEASDLGVPLVGVGFMYPQGYFHQHVSAEGWQEESNELLNWVDAPIEPAMTPDGKPCLTPVPLDDRSVLVAVWRVRVGRVQLYLLDTNLEENAPWDRELSARLYGGDRETRIQQEIILGIGGVRALRALGIEPGVFHLNEGHAAFVVLQRIRELIDRGSTLRRRARGDPADDGLHDAHAGAGRARRVPVSPRRKASRRLLGHARAQPRSVPRARVARQRRRPAVQHDGARAAVGRQGQRRQPAPRRGHARDVGHLARRARAGAAGDVGHQRRARADVDRRRSGGALRAATSAPTGCERQDDPDVLERRARDSGRRTVARAADAAPLPVRVRPRARAPALDRGTRRHPARRRRRAAARSRRADDRLRAAVRRLQAAGADLPRPRAARAHPERAPDGRCRSSSPASRIRPTTSASIICSASTGTRSIRCSAAASRSSTTTTCTSRISSCRAATSG